jgi:hypothetical protein
MFFDNKHRAFVKVKCFFFSGWGLMSEAGSASTLLRAVQIFGISREACSKTLQPEMVSKLFELAFIIIDHLILLSIESD